MAGSPRGFLEGSQAEIDQPKEHGGTPCGRVGRDLTLDARLVFFGDCWRTHRDLERMGRRSAIAAENVEKGERIEGWTAASQRDHRSDMTGPD